MRRLDALRRDQRDVLESYRQEGQRPDSVALLPRPGGVLAPVVYGRVTEVVGSDPTHGPHVRVVRQRWTGRPPVRSDVEGTAVRCYPTPNRTVADYSVGDFVRLVAARGAMVAEALA